MTFDATQEINRYLLRSIKLPIYNQKRVDIKNPWSDHGSKFYPQNSIQ